MLETAIIVATYCATFLAGAVAYRIVIDVIEKRAYSLVQSERGTKGVEARRNNEERMAMAVAEAMHELKNGQSPPEVFKNIGAKYPDVLAKLAGKAMRGKLPPMVQDMLGEFE